LIVTGETVEKVPKQILGGNAEKNDFTECATINDLTIMKGRKTPKNQALTILKGFSTVSVERECNGGHERPGGSRARLQRARSTFPLGTNSISGGAYSGLPEGSLWRKGHY
jgi:hypothetical protein